MKKWEEIRELFLSAEKVGLTIDRLVGDGYLSADRGDHLTKSLPRMIQSSEYVLWNLGAHMAIGAVFAFDVIPLPLGTISRDLWVIGNRIYQELRRDYEKKKVHSFSVLVVSTIPLIGYFAYLLPLKRVSEDAAYIYANHVAYLRNNVSFERYLETKPKFVRKMLTQVLVPGYLLECRRMKE